jgi:hypothetical protein
MSSPPLYKWGCHYTIPLYYAVLYYNILYSDAILYSQWRWHPNLSQEGGFGTPISLYSTVLDYTLLYYTILSFTKVEVVSPSLHHGRVWIRVRSSSPPIHWDVWNRVGSSTSPLKRGGRSKATDTGHPHRWIEEI